MNAFVTGSQAYGTPSEESDVDLVVRCNWDTANTLRKISDDVLDEATLTDNSDRRLSLRFGKLNILCCVTDRQYAEWVLGTNVLVDKKPVQREDAVKQFVALRSLA